MFAIYEIATGQLVSVGTVTASDEELAARGLARKEVASTDGIWNPATLAFDPRPPAPVQMTPVDFLRRFTLEERGTIRAARATDPAVDDFLYRLELAQFVEIPSQDTVEGLAYLVSVGLLSQARADAIGAP